MNKYLTGAAASIAGALLLTPISPASAIIDGAPDDGEHPFVGQLLFYVPEAEDSRFDDSGSWYVCSGTLIDADTVVTAGHCTYGVGEDGAAPDSPLYGGTDVWFSVEEEPDFSILQPSSTYDRDENDERYADWSSALDASKTWYETESTFTHPEYVDSAFLYHDLGVLELAKPVRGVTEFGSLPEENYLDKYYSKSAKQRGLFESVGYGLEKSSPHSASGGDTRRKIDQKLISFEGAYGLKDISVNFSQGTCFGDSGGPTFDISSPAIAEQNIIVAVTSFGFTSTCTAGGSYRIDQPDDLAFLADPAGADYS